MTIAKYICTAFFYSVSCLAFGEILIRFLRREKYSFEGVSWYFSAATSFMVGQGLLSALWLFLALAKSFTELNVWLIVSIFFLFGAGLFIRCYNLIAPLIANTLISVKSISFFWLLLFFSGVFLMFIFGIKALLLPPSGDAEAFYMVLPKIVAASGRLAPQPNYYEFTQIGLNAEMHYAALIAISGPPAAKLFTWITGCALIVLLFGLCSECGLAVRGKIAALIILLTSTTYSNYLTDGKVDLFGAAFGLAAFCWALRVTPTAHWIFPLITGFLAGLATVAKFSNIPVVLAGIFIILLWNYLEHKNDVSCKATLFWFAKMSLLCIFAGILAWIPHLIKNLILFNEPFAPFYFIFSKGSKWVDQVWFSRDTTRYILSTYPVALIYGQYPMQGGNLSPFVLAFAPLYFLANWERPLYRNRLFKVLVVALLGVVVWMLVRPAVVAPRYILAVLLLFVPIAASVVENVGIQKRRTISVMVYASLMFSALVLIKNEYPGTMNLLRQRLSVEHVSCHPTSAYCNSLTNLNKMAQPGDRIYLGGYYSYFLDATLLQCIQRPAEAGTLASWQSLFDHGFRYLVIQKATHLNYIEQLNTSVKPNWLMVVKVFDDGNSMIYSIDSTDPNVIASTGCKQVSPPAWDVVTIK